MKVEQLMTRNVQMCLAGEALSAVARIMWERDCGCVPVVEREDGAARVIGMITDRDICMAAYTQGRPLSEIKVGSVMTKEVRSCHSADSIASALNILEQSQVHRLPVVDQNDHLIGVLSLADIAREAAREHVRGTKEVNDVQIGAAIEAISAPRGCREVAAAG